MPQQPTSTPVTVIAGDFLPAEVKVKSNEKRAEPRQHVTLKLRASALNTPHSKDFEVTCIELSTQGMSFRTPTNFKPGDMLAVRMPVRNGGGRILRCRTRHSHASAPGLYVVGVEFVEAVSMRTEKTPIPAAWFSAPETRKP